MMAVMCFQTQPQADGGIPVQATGICLVRPVVCRHPEVHAFVFPNSGNVAYSDSRIRATHNPYIALTWTAPERFAYVKCIQLEIS